MCVKVRLQEAGAEEGRAKRGFGLIRLDLPGQRTWKTHLESLELIDQVLQASHFCC